MEPFNVKIQAGDNSITLTILPVDMLFYKVVYFGSIIGAVRKLNDNAEWEAVSNEELTAGDLPFYQKNGNEDHLDLELDAATTGQIGQAIEMAYTDDLSSEKSS